MKSFIVRYKPDPNQGMTKFKMCQGLVTLLGEPEYIHVSVPGIQFGAVHESDELYLRTSSELNHTLQLML